MKLFLRLRPRSLTQKLCLSLGTGTGLVLAASIWGGVEMTSRIIIHDVERQARKQVEETALEMDSILERAAQIPQGIAARQRAAGYRVDKELFPYIVEMMRNLPPEQGQGIYMTYDFKSYKDPDCEHWVTRATWPKSAVASTYDYHDPKQEWYAGPIRTKKVYVTEPYFDDGGANVNMVSVTLPVYDTGKRLIGVAGIDLTLDELRKAATGLKLEDIKANEKNGDAVQFPFVASRSGLLVVHPDERLLPRKDFAGASLKDVAGVKEANGQAKGEGVVRVGKEQRRLYWTTAPLSGWKVGISVSEKALMAPVMAFRVRGLLAGIGSLVLLMGIVVVLSRRITRPLLTLARTADALAKGDVAQEITIRSEDELGAVAESFRTLIAYQKQMATVAEAIAQGDLTGKITPKSDRDALGIAFQEMTERMAQLLGSVAGNAANVAGTSVALATFAGQTDRTATQIARNIQEVTAAAEHSARTSQEMAVQSREQAHSTEEAGHAMTCLQEAALRVQDSNEKQHKQAEETDREIQNTGLAAESVSEAVRLIAETAQQAAHSAESGEQAVALTISSMGRIRQQVAVSAGHIQELGRRGEEIRAIVQTIEQIAEQTNLLALNAAIEAARAGEHGRGFAVVAGEVRRLAELAAGSTSEIRAIIQSVRSEVEKSVLAMECSDREVLEGVTRSEEAGAKLAQIQSSARQVTTTVDEAALLSRKMTESMQAALYSMQAVCDVIAENRREMLEMATGAAQVTDAIGVIKAISTRTALGAEDLSAIAEEVYANAREVAEAVGEQTCSIAQISESAREQKQQAEELNALLQQFRIASESIPEDTSYRKAA